MTDPIRSRAAGVWSNVRAIAIRASVVANLVGACWLFIGCAEPGDITLDPTIDTESPFEQGATYAGCNEASDCESAWCLRPADEPGFCTQPCSAPEQCEQPGGQAVASCVAVEADAACALDCGGGKACPAGMRCEQVEAEGEPRSLCF